MAIFRLSALNGSVSMLVRARCLTCARQVATANARQEGTRTWASREHSVVELVREPRGYTAEGRSELLERIEHGAI